MQVYAIVLLSLYGAYALWALVYVCYLYKKLSFLSHSQITSNPKYPALNRTDYQHWNRFHFFLGAAIVFPIRIIMLMVVVIPVVLILRLCGCFCCVDISGKGPRKGCMLWFFTKLIQCAARMCLFIMGFYWITTKKIKPQLENVEGLDDWGNWPQAVMIGNHVTYTDGFFHVYNGPNSFIAGHQLKEFPMFGFICKVIQFIFVDTRSKESRAKTFTMLEERIDNIGKNPKGGSF